MNLSGDITNGIGQPVRRKEDFRLLTGRGSFADDVHLSGLAHAVIVRSPHAHAHIASIHKAAALASPGVLAVLTMLCCGSAMQHKDLCAPGVRTWKGTSSRGDPSGFR